MFTILCWKSNGYFFFITANWDGAWVEPYLSAFSIFTAGIPGNGV